MHKYQRVSGYGLNRYYIVGGSIATNRTHAHRLSKSLSKQQQSIDQVVDGIVSAPPVNRKKSVNFIKSLAK